MFKPAQLETLCRRIDALLAGQPSVQIAIDGHCASGKSTLGALLAERYPANLLHMDDFYVPFARKTPERLAEPGGNVDYERFAAEVPEKPDGQPFAYRRFDCAAQTLDAPTHLPPRPLTIVEGSYSLHPTLRNRYDLKIFLTVDPETQRARILERNGAEKLRQFESLWIPLENRYFDAFNIPNLCDLVMDTTPTSE